MKYCFGVDLGGTTTKIGLFKTDGALFEKWEIPTRTANAGEAVLSDIADAVFNKAKEHGITKKDISGIGIGVPAAVKADGFVVCGENLNWKNKEVKRELEERTGMTVCAGNDANVAALGEMWKGSGQAYKNFVMVTLGTGVGGAIIIDGHILAGVNGAGAEIGNIIVNTEETELCSCGRKGCLEQYVSATGIVRLAKRRLAQNTQKTVLNPENITAKDVFDAVKAGDAVAMQIADQFGRCLGYALANLATVVDPEAFVIGGGVSKAGTILLDYIEKHYAKIAYSYNRNVKFVLAELENDAGIYGAAKLVLN